MTTAIIIQARIGSSRLPGKVVLSLPNSCTVLGEVIQRCAEVTQADHVLVAAPAHDYHILEVAAQPEFDEEWAHLIGVDGDENDVLRRYALAAEAVNAETIVRITADCPLMSSYTIDKCIDLHRRTGADYTSNIYPSRSYPKGFDVEVFSRALLTSAFAAAGDPYDREHVTPWMQRITRGTPRMALLKAHKDKSHLNYCLDTIEDYRRIWDILADDDRSAED